MRVAPLLPTGWDRNAAPATEAGIGTGGPAPSTDGGPVPKLAGMRYHHHRVPVQSEVLRGNPLGDPTERTLHLLAPVEVGADPLPVIWILPGYSGTAEAQLASDPWSPGLHQRVEKLAAEGMPDAIIAVPDFFTSLGGCQYLSSPAVGRYEEHLWQELRPAVEARFPAGKNGLAGKSSGGFGALLHAIRHPRQVHAVACHSGDMCFEYAYLADLPKLAGTLEKYGGVEAFLAAFASDPKRREGKWIGPLNVLCMAAVYSPDPQAPRGIGLPFDPATAALLPDVWERWLAFDPVRLAQDPAVLERLKQLDLLFLDCGSRDEYHLQWGLRQLVARLRAAGVPHEHEEFDDGHRGTSYRYEVSLPKLVRALRR